MKSVKTKLATALFLAGLMAGFFSFSTTRIAAQETSSTATTSTVDDEKRLVAEFTRFVGQVAERIRFLTGTGLIVADYPADALD